MVNGFHDQSEFSSTRRGSNKAYVQSELSHLPPPSDRRDVEYHVEGQEDDADVLRVGTERAVKSAFVLADSARTRVLYEVCAKKSTQSDAHKLAKRRIRIFLAGTCVKNHDSGKWNLKTFWVSFRRRQRLVYDAK